MKRFSVTTLFQLGLQGRLAWRRLSQLAIALFITLALVACAAGTPPDEGTEAESPTPAETAASTAIAPAERTVALTSLTADILQQLDANKLVGIPGSRLLANDPRFDALTEVSSGQTEPNLEKIVALKPDLVVGARGFHDRVLQRLKELKIPTLTVEVNSLQALTELTETLATAVEADPAPLLQRYQACLSDVSATQSSVLVLVSRQPILAPNKESWAGSLLDRFKANNVAADLQGQSPVRGYVTLSAEKILTANPDVILLVDLGSDLLAEFQAQSFWQQLQAVKENRISSFDYYGLVNPGSVERIEQTCNQLREVLSGVETTAQS